MGSLGVPDPEEPGTREFLRVRPSVKPLATDRLTGQFEQVHAAVDGAALECLLASNRDMAEIEYYFETGLEAHRSLQRVLARIFPDSHRFETVTEDPLTPIPEEPAATPILEGVGQRSDDWQTRLRPPSISDAPEKHETARVETAPDLPLESIVEGMLAAGWHWTVEDRVLVSDEDSVHVNHVCRELSARPSASRDGQPDDGRPERPQEDREDSVATNAPMLWDQVARATGGLRIRRRRRSRSRCRRTGSRPLVPAW